MKECIPGQSHDSMEAYFESKVWSKDMAIVFQSTQESVNVKTHTENYHPYLSLVFRPISAQFL